LCSCFAKINARSQGNASALHYAALAGEAASIQILLNYKANTSYKISSLSVYGWFDADMNALHTAAQSGNCAAISLLLATKISLSENTKGHCSLIFFAARSNNPAAVKLLLDAGASPNISSPRYFNDPLREAILRENTALAAQATKI
jgi:ankyrin repeat protein